MYEKIKYLMKRTFQFLGGVLGIGLLCLAILQNSSLKKTIVERGAAIALKESGQQISVEQVQGFFPFYINIPTIQVFDIKNIQWLTIKNFEFKAPPLKFLANLLRGHIVIEKIGADEIECLTTPARPITVPAKNSQPAPEKFRVKIPNIEVGSIAVPTINITKQVFGQQVELQLNGSLTEAKQLLKMLLEINQKKKDEVEHFVTINCTFPHKLKSFRDVLIQIKAQERGEGFLWGIINSIIPPQDLDFTRDPEISIDINGKGISKEVFDLKGNFYISQLGQGALNISLQGRQGKIEGSAEPFMQTNYGRKFDVKANFTSKDLLIFANQLALHNINVSSEVLNLGLNGDIDLKESLFKGVVTAQVNDLGKFRQSSIYATQGQANLVYTGLINYDSLDIQGVIKGQLNQAEFNNLYLQDLIGKEANFSISVDKTQEVSSIREILLDTSRKNKITGQLVLDTKQDKLEGSLTAAVNNLVKFDVGSNKADGKFKGSLSLTGDGPLSDPNVRFSFVADEAYLNGKKLQDFKGNIVLTHITKALSADIDFLLRDNQVDLVLKSHLNQLSPVSYEITHFDLKGPKTNIFLSGQVDLETAIFDGKAEGRIDDLSLYSRWFGGEWSGKISLQGDRAPGKELNLQATIDNLKVPGIVIKKGNLLTKYNIAEKSGVGKVDIAGFKIGGTKAKECNLDIKLKEGKGPIEFKGFNKGKVPWDCQIKGVIDLKTEKTIRLDVFYLKHLKHNIKLGDPVTFTLSPIIKINDLQLKEYKTGETQAGYIHLKNFEWGEKYKGDLNFKNMTLHFLSLIHSDINLRGHLTGEAHLRGDALNPQLLADLQVKTLKLARTNDIFGVDTHLKVDLKDNHLNWEIVLKGARNFSLQSKGVLEDMFGWEVTRRTSISSQLNGKGDLSYMNAFLVMGDHVEGSLESDLRLSGLALSPSIHGKLNIHKGYYENLKFGTVLRDLNIEIQTNDKTIYFKNFTAKDQKTGVFNIKGDINFKDFDDPIYNLGLKANTFILASNDDIKTQANVDLSFKGKGKDAAIKGSVDVTQASLWLEMFATTEIEKIKIREIDGRVINEDPEAEEEASRKNYFPIDVKVNFSKSLNLGGYGLTSNWEGKLEITHFATQPLVMGRLSLVEGKANLLNQTLKLEEGGYVIFDNTAENDPLLNLKASREMPELKAFVVIEGRASDVKIKFSSSPAMPQEEILSHLLFNKGRKNISTAQAMLLANYLKDITLGRNKDLFTQMHNIIGIDVLEIKEVGNSGDEGEGSSGYALSIGKKLSDKVSITWDQGVGKDAASKATLEAQVSDQVRLEADVGAERSTGVAVMWVKRY